MVDFTRVIADSTTPTALDMSVRSFARSALISITSDPRVAIYQISVVRLVGRLLFDLSGRPAQQGRNLPWRGAALTLRECEHGLDDRSQDFFGATARVVGQSLCGFLKFIEWIFLWLLDHQPGAAGRI